MSRNPLPFEPPWKHIIWDTNLNGPWLKQLSDVRTIINLAGRNVDCVKSPEHCDEILRSRVESTLTIGKALKSLGHQPDTWIQMSTAHIYGDPPQQLCDEFSETGLGLAPDVGRQWEEAFYRSAPEKTRKVIFRTSFVLGSSGGALQRLIRLAKLGLGGTIGHGQQGISWIHQNDMNRLFLQSIENQKMQGVYLATSPQPVSNHEFMSALRKVLNVPVGFSASSWMVKFGAPLFMKTDPDMALYGRYCRSVRLPDLPFRFTYPELFPALKHLLGSR